MCVCMSAQSCLTLHNTMGCSPPGPSVRGISQARTLEWVAISFSGGASRLRGQTQVSCIGRWTLYPWKPHHVYSYMYMSTCVCVSSVFTYIAICSNFLIFISPSCFWTTHNWPPCGPTPVCIPESAPISPSEEHKHSYSPWSLGLTWHVSQSPEKAMKAAMITQTSPKETTGSPNTGCMGDEQAR